MKIEGNELMKEANFDCKIDYKKLGERIRIMRNIHQLKQAGLASKVGVNSNHISNIECGKAHVSLQVLYKISIVFNCTIDDLLSDNISVNENKWTDFFKEASDFELHMLDDFIKSLLNNKKYIEEREI